MTLRVNYKCNPIYNNISRDCHITMKSISTCNIETSESHTICRSIPCIYNIGERLKLCGELQRVNLSEVIVDGVHIYIVDTRITRFNASIWNIIRATNTCHEHDTRTVINNDTNILNEIKINSVRFYIC